MPGGPGTLCLHHPFFLSLFPFTALPRGGGECKKTSHRRGVGGMCFLCHGIKIRGVKRDSYFGQETVVLNCVPEVSDASRPYLPVLRHTRTRGRGAALPIGAAREAAVPGHWWGRGRLQPIPIHSLCDGVDDNRIPYPLVLQPKP